MSLIVCTMPQCQTAAGCICERQLRPVRSVDARYDRNALDQIEQRALAALGNRDPAKMLDEMGSFYDELPTPRDQRALTLVLAMHVHVLAIKQERQPVNDALLRILFAKRAGT